MIWTMLGVAVGVAAAFCILAAELIAAFPLLDGHRAVAAAVFAALGAAVGLPALWRRRQQPKSEVAAEAPASLTALLGPPFWGAMLLVFAGITLFIQPLRRAEQQPVTAREAAPTPRPVVKAGPTPQATNSPVTFPALKIQGCILVQGNPVVLIDGEAFEVGDEVKGATIKSIASDGVVLEKNGVTKNYKIQ